jgi:hypothetical protein
MFDRTLSAAEPADIVAQLRRWCPRDASTVALAIHELAAWQYDDGRIERWRCVLELLQADQKLPDGSACRDK